MSPRRRPLYARMLRLRHLKLRPAVAFLLFEGSIGLGVLLALAEIVNGWGIVAVPVTVAVMVKLNDIVAGALAQVAHVAPVGVPPPVVSAEAAVPPQNRATQPGRGASMRRTRGIVGRARLGSARGIVYVHPKPPDPRRPGAAYHDPATALSPDSLAPSGEGRVAGHPPVGPDQAGESGAPTGSRSAEERGGLDDREGNAPGPGETTIRVPPDEAGPGPRAADTRYAAGGEDARGRTSPAGGHRDGEESARGVDGGPAGHVGRADAGSVGRGTARLAGREGGTDDGSAERSPGSGSAERSAGGESDGEILGRGTGDARRDRDVADRGNAGLDPAVTADGNPPAPQDQPDPPNPDPPNRTDRNKGRFA